MKHRKVKTQDNVSMGDCGMDPVILTDLDVRLGNYLLSKPAEFASPA